jgi:hypothetical protein
MKKKLFTKLYYKLQSYFQSVSAKNKLDTYIHYKKIFRILKRLKGFENEGKVSFKPSISDLENHYKNKLNELNKNTG